MTKSLFDTAIGLLARRAHGKEELRRKLRRKASSHSVDEVLSKLEGKGYLNDREFAFGRARSLRRDRGWGSRRIHVNLMNLGVDARIIELVLNELNEAFPEEESLRKTIDSWVRLRGEPVQVSDLKRLFDHCCRLGYASGHVRTHLHEWFGRLKWGETSGEDLV